MPVLYCRHLDKRTQWKVLAGESFTLGFSNAASVPIPDGSLAPREVIVSRSGDRYVLRDLAERGRVLLNGAVAREAHLEDGDRMQVGRVSILFLDDARIRGGEVDLYPREAGPEMEAKRWETLEAEGDRDPRPAEPEREERKGRALVTCFAIALIAGFAIGLLAIRVPDAPDRAPRAGAKAIPAMIEERDPPAPPPGAEAAAPAPEEGDPGRRIPVDGATLEKLDEIRRQAEEGTKPPPRQEEGTPAKASARLEAATPRTGGTPARAESAATAADRSRLALFRLFLDLAERPPTREEEGALSPLPHAERFQRILETARREGLPVEPGLPVPALFQLWIGRPPSAAELAEITSASSSRHAASLWISSLPEYSSFERRRTRSVRQRARSLIVDLLDRPPAGDAEVELVETALREPRSLEHVSRTLLLSPESKLADEAGGRWETEFFRFLLREPGPAERAEIGRLLEGLPAAEARRRLALALVDFPEYRSY
jgi:hypothetical protein